MKKFKALVLGLTMVCALGMMTACGKVPEVEEDDVIEALEDSEIISKDAKKDSYSVEIKETELNDDEDKATVTCVLTRTEGYLKYVTEYELKFKLNSDKDGWKYRDKYEAGETKQELAKGIAEEDLENILEWKSIYIEDEEVYLDFDDEISKYEVAEQDTDLKEKKDVLTLECEAESGFSKYVFTAKMTFTYDYGWSLQETEVTECEVSYVEGYEVTLDGETLATDLADDNEYVYHNGCYYYFGECEISDVTVGEMNYDGYYATTDATLTMTMNGTSVVVEMEVEYYFDDDDMKWEFYWLNDCEVVDYASDIVGTWIRTDDDGTTYTLVIKEDLNESGQFLAEVTVKNSVETYSYKAYVDSYDPRDGDIYIYASEWIVEPVESYGWMDSFSGTITEGKTFSADWGTWTFTKQ